jgi:hypothetical protein
MTEQDALEQAAAIYAGVLADPEQAERLREHRQQQTSRTA